MKIKNNSNYQNNNNTSNNFSASTTPSIHPNLASLLPNVTSNINANNSSFRFNQIPLTQNASNATQSTPSFQPSNSTNTNGLYSVSNDEITSQILTRSAAAQRSAAAAAAAAASVATVGNQKQQFHKRVNHNHHNSTSHHHQHQHVVGKIVKPIPVRPVSSSSSSTHSSSFSTNHHNHCSHHNNSKIHAVLTNTTLNTDTMFSNDNNFSLIAKYFASFPATRLKSTNFAESINNNGTFSNGASSSSSPIIMNQTLVNSPMVTKSTPFLPFKKQQSNNTSNNTKSQNLISNSCASTFSIVTNYPNAEVSNSNSNSSNTNVGDSNNQPISFNLRSNHNNSQHMHHNTDHLCTNFKRMIKLNDHQTNITNDELNAASPQTQTAASNTPTGLLDSDDSEKSLFITNNETSSNFSSNSNQQVNDQNLFSQITMETRSTRKFLIKHHPYLQMNNINLNSEKSLNYHNQQPRPSINLIKMKKLICQNNQNNNELVASNKSDYFQLSTDHKLVKFTDLAPLPSSLSAQSLSNGLNTAPQQSDLLKIKNSSSNLLNTNQIKTRRQSSKITPTVLLNNDKNYQHQNKTKFNSKQLANNSRRDENDFINCSEFNINDFYDSYYYDDEELNVCSIQNNINNSSFNNNSNKNSVNTNGEDCCDIDDSHEDSSGYYSSYHSVDLISSSGGSSGGDMNKQNSNINLITNAIASNGNTNKLNSKNDNTIINPAQPHHHYHTRYFTNYIQQNNQTTINNSTPSQTNRRNRSTTPTSQLLQASSSKQINYTTPTTRLRYQQQLLAAANSANANEILVNKQYKNHNHHQECGDLDLDQIEND